jgi:tRNA (guanine37-N1)-methyltransferase
MRGLSAPEVLLSGDHGRIRRWRRREALRATRERRPDLLASARLDAVDAGLLREIEDEAATTAPRRSEAEASVPVTRADEQAV